MRYVFGLILILSFLSPKAQSPGLTDVRNSINSLADNFPQEKIYLHFDKASYTPGESVWFKAYIVTGLQPSYISKTVYVDFINADGRVVKHCVQPVYQATANGNFDIPVEYANEVLFVKAYTRWMLNFDSTFFFHKTIHLNPTKPAQKKTVTAEKTTISFLPEGGDLVESIESKVAFKAVHSDNKPADVKGVVADSKGARVADIKTMHDGMGFFTLEPKPGEKYAAEWKDEFGNTYKTDLPAAKPFGANLAVKLQDNSRSFMIRRSENAPDNFQKLYIVATMQQNLVYMAGVDLSQSFVTGGSIPITDLPSGILQVSLFDANWVAIAERITFINHQEYYFQPEVGFSQLGTGKRKQNTLVVNVPDSVGANLSVSVTDAGIGTDSSDDIVSHFLLTSDLRGNIYHPYYYFTDSTDSLQEQLDLVMLTNGWRRINWQDVVNGKMPKIKYQNDTDYLKLSGKIYGATSDDLKHGAFLLTILDNSDDTARRLEQLPIETNGNFSNADIILYDTTTAYYKLMGSETLAGSAAISFNSSMASPSTVRIDTAATVLFSDSATENYKRKLAQRQMLALKMQQGTTLAEVTVHARVKSAAQILDEKYTSPLFSSDDAYKFDALNDPIANNGQNVLEYIRGRVAGLQIVTGGQGQASARWRGGTPTFYLNEMPVEIDQLASTSMADVAYVKVFRPPFIGSIGGGANGAVAVYTRKGGDTKPKAGKGLPYKIIIGYTAEKEFYSPDYATFNSRNELDDLRTTLYWNPMVLTTKENHTIRLRFYNNDFTQSFRVVLEGMTTDGRIAHVEKVVE